MPSARLCYAFLLQCNSNSEEFFPQDYVLLIYYCNFFCNCISICVCDESPCSSTLSHMQRNIELSIKLDLRHSSTTPLNFTKSINLALSERGIHSMRLARSDGLLENVLKETIPMHARMIHGRRKNGELFEESQKYDAHGRVCTGG